jgi:NAD(P)-dependent dehydrogenase (short-subunit alcohol dehydrogenase family)
MLDRMIAMAQNNSETTATNMVKDVADQIKGKVILTTGVSPGGLGAAFVESIAAAQPELLILAGRGCAKVRETAEVITTCHPDVKVRLLELDLSSLAAVRRAAGVVLGWDDVPKIDVLVNNAGVMGIEYARSADGIEMTLATNYLGPFLFTNLLMSKLLEAESPRVVMLGSEGHRWNPMRWGDYGFQVHFTGRESIEVCLLTGLYTERCDV